MLTVIAGYLLLSGNAARYASDLGTLLRSSFNVSFFDSCGVNAAADMEVLSLIKASTLTIFVSSTQGNGELPSLSHKFFSGLFEKNGSLLKGKQCAVLGFGSSSYPIFCGSAIHLSKKLAENDADEVIPRGECDSVKVSYSLSNIIQFAFTPTSLSGYVLLIITYFFRGD